MFGQETPHQQPSDEAKNCPEQHQEADTHQEAGSPARLAQVLRHHHLVTKLSAVSHLSDDPSFSLSVTVCPPWCVAGYWPVSLGPGILLPASGESWHWTQPGHQASGDTRDYTKTRGNKLLEGFYTFLQSGLIVWTCVNYLYNLKTMASCIIEFLIMIKPNQRVVISWENLLQHVKYIFFHFTAVDFQTL